MRSRIRSIFRRLETEVDLVVVANGTYPHVDMCFYYATGLDHGLFEGSLALISPQGLEIITSLLEGESARHPEADVTVYKERKERAGILRERLSGCRRIGIDPPELTHKWYKELSAAAPKGARLIDVSKALMAARLVKDRAEVSRMRRACRIAAEAASEIIPELREGVREYEVSAGLTYLMQQRGASGPAFDTIVAFGKMSAEPHYVAGDAKLRRGEIVLLDFGALYRRYRSDITRTYIFGRATPKQKEMYELVLDAQTAALRRMKPGVKGGDVHRAAERRISRSRFKGRFTHAVGHSIGLATHDGSGLHPSIPLTLEPGMIFTVEPGVYLPGYGGVRIEDDVLITKDGCEVLTPAPKELIEVS
ncbi:MAG: Xaa-Pro peptidase family protein [Candidatus Thermoplasmatota archaeon]